MKKRGNPKGTVKKKIHENQRLASGTKKDQDCLEKEHGFAAICSLYI
jgi:hypothetical protein